MIFSLILSTLIAWLLPKASGHAAIFHPSMYGFNVTQQTFSYDNRPVSPLTNYTFEQWWFHGHIDYPPNEGDYFELPAGGAATAEIACDKGATSYFASAPGGNIQSGDDVCPGSPPSEYHTTGPDDLKGCSLAIAYKSNVTEVQPEDFVVFSVNQTCVWNRFTDFQVPAAMPPCPEGGCHCAFFWIHSADSGGEQNYMNGFKCNVTGSTSDVALATPQVARRCGADPANDKPNAVPGNCTYGAKAPFYWFQAERNNMFEGTYSPPYYLDLYNFEDGAQNDIFANSYPSGLPVPGPNQTLIPTPVAYTPNVAAATPAPSSTAGTSSVAPSSASSASASLSTSNSGVPTSAASLLASSSAVPTSSSSPANSSSVAAPASTSVSSPVSVSVSVVVSTLVVTVTAGAPAASGSALANVSSTASGVSFASVASSTFPGASSLPSSALSSGIPSSQASAAASLSSSAPFFPTAVPSFASQQVPSASHSSASNSSAISGVTSTAGVSSSDIPSLSASAAASSSGIASSLASSAIASSSKPFFPTAVSSFASQLASPSASSVSAPPASEFASAATTILLNQPTGSSASSGFGSANVTTPTATPAAGALFEVNAAAAPSSASASATPSVCGSSIVKRNLRARMVDESNSQSFFALRSHRRLRDRSQLWHIF